MHHQGTRPRGALRTQMPRLHARPFTSTFFIAKDAPMVCAAHAAARVSSQQRRVDRSAARIELRHARRSFRRTYCRGTGRRGKFCRHQAGLRTHGLRLSCRDARVVDCLGLQTHRGAPTSDQLAPWREKGLSGRPPKSSRLACGQPRVRNPRNFLCIQGYIYLSNLLPTA